MIRAGIQMDKDEKDFQRYFKEYQKLFGLLGYQVYFERKSLESGFASIVINQTDMVATVKLNNNTPDKPFKDIKKSAKHEAIHLLIGRLGRSQYLSENEIYEASEELIHKLEGLINE